MCSLDERQRLDRSMQEGGYEGQVRFRNLSVCGTQKMADVVMAVSKMT